MIKTISFYDFQDAFNESDSYKNHFTYDAQKALFDYIENVEQETETPIELDIVGLACDYSEYPDLTTLQKEYDNIESFDDLEQHTTVIYTKEYQDPTAPFIISSF